MEIYFSVLNVLLSITLKRAKTNKTKQPFKKPRLNEGERKSAVFLNCVGYYKAVILPDNIFSKLNPAKLSGLPKNSTHYFRSPRSGSRDKGNPNINLNKKQTISMDGNGVDELTSKFKCGLTAKVGRRVRALPELIHLYVVLEPAGHYFDH